MVPGFRLCRNCYVLRFVCVKIGTSTVHPHGVHGLVWVYAPGTVTVHPRCVVDRETACRVKRLIGRVRRSIIFKFMSIIR